MGLDMYLNANRYMSKWFAEGDAEKQSAIQMLFPELTGLQDNFDGSVIKEISIEAGYWRKANAIHDWFVRNVQEGEDDCGNYRVDREQLCELKEACEKVLEGVSEPQDELPTANGFFFGSTDYDQWYYDNLKHTVAIIDRCLALPQGWDFEYHSSW